MSLINEALKRAELDKHRRRPGEAPAEADARLGAWPAAEEEISRMFGKNQTGLRGAVILGLCVIASVAAVMYWSLPPDQNGPDSAKAGISAATQPAQPNMTQQKVSPQAKPSAADETKHAAREALLPAFAPHREKLPPAANNVADLSQNPPGKTPPPSPDKPTPASGPAAEQFKLGGILQSGTGAYAIINNHLVLVGDEVNGARIISIQKHQVVLVKDGKRLILRM